jgi:hypothetical protein
MVARHKKWGLDTLLLLPLPARGTTLLPHDASGDNSDRLSPFYRCSQHRRTRSERKVVTDRTLKAWYHASIA